MGKDMRRQQNYKEKGNIQTTLSAATGDQKRLEDLKKSELIALIKELMRLDKNNQAFVQARFATGAEIAKPVEHYKQVIRNEFFPTKGFGQLRLRVAKKAISDFKKASNDIKTTLDLMIYYVEMGVAYTNKFGDINENFYSSMETVFSDVIDILTVDDNAELARQFLPRLQKIVDDTAGMGWGFHDNLSYMLDELVVKE